MTPQEKIVLGMAEEISVLRSHNADLLAALREIADLESEIGDSHRYRYAAIARAAIAKVEQT